MAGSASLAARQIVEGASNGRIILRSSIGPIRGQGHVWRIRIARISVPPASEKLAGGTLWWPPKRRPCMRFTEELQLASCRAGGRSTPTLEKRPPAGVDWSYSRRTCRLVSFACIIILRIHASPTPCSSRFAASAHLCIGLTGTPRWVRFHHAKCSIAKCGSASEIAR